VFGYGPFQGNWNKNSIFPDLEPIEVQISKEKAANCYGENMPK
jgi:hypothetical protein